METTVPIHRANIQAGDSLRLQLASEACHHEKVSWGSSLDQRMHEEVWFDASNSCTMHCRKLLYFICRFESAGVQRRSRSSHTHARLRKVDLSAWHGAGRPGCQLCSMVEGGPSKLWLPGQILVKLKVLLFGTWMLLRVSLECQVKQEKITFQIVQQIKASFRLEQKDFDCRICGKMSSMIPSIRDHLTVDDQ